MGARGLMSVREYASKRGVSVQYVYQMIRSGKLESLKVGSILLVLNDSESKKV